MYVNESHRAEHATGRLVAVSLNTYWTGTGDKVVA